MSIPRNLDCSIVQCCTNGDLKYTAGALHEKALQTTGTAMQRESRNFMALEDGTIVTHELIQNLSRTTTLMIKSWSDWRGQLAKYRDWMALIVKSISGLVGVISRSWWADSRKL